MQCSMNAMHCSVMQCNAVYCSVIMLSHLVGRPMNIASVIFAGTIDIGGTSDIGGTVHGYMAAFYAVFSCAVWGSEFGFIDHLAKFNCGINLWVGGFD